VRGVVAVQSALHGGEPRGGGSNWGLSDTLLAGDWQVDAVCGILSVDVSQIDDRNAAEGVPYRVLG